MASLLLCAGLMGGAGAPARAADSPDRGDTLRAAGRTVRIAAGASIQAAIDANPAGTTFLLPSGVWHQQVIAPKTDDRFIGAEDGGTILTGDDVTAELANNGSGQIGTGVQFKNITVAHYMPGFQQGAISGVVGWSFENCTFAHMGNKGNGLDPGRNSRIHGGRFIYNAANGISASKADNLVIEDAEIAYNNAARLDIDNDTGGMKITASDHVQILGNAIHDNYGDGIWADVHATNWTISGNSITDNTYNGIHWETSDGATIAGNVIIGNGAGPGRKMAGAAIYISSSGGARVSGNTVVVPNGADGIVMQTIGRPDQVTAANNVVTGNVVTFRGRIGENGWRAYAGGALGAGNRFDGNLYRIVRSTDAHWVWGGDNTGMSWRRYHAVSGQDAYSVLHLQSTHAATR